MISHINIKITTLLLGCCLSGSVVFAQKDTTKRPTIDITSSYKPVLRNAVKINFSATNLTADTSRVSLQYNVPAQSLFYTYQPVSLKPLALEHDTSLELGSRYYVKAGFGNYTTPYVKAAGSFGDGETLLVNGYADYISSQGNIKNQDYSQLNIKATASYFRPKFEIYGSAGISQDQYYLYGYDHTLYDYKRKDIRQHFGNVNLKAGIRNTIANDMDISYDPSIAVNIFSNHDQLLENTFVIEAPVKKELNDEFAVKLTAKADVTSYSNEGLLNNKRFSNAIYQLAPAVEYTAPQFNIHGGVIPSWDNGKLNVLPDVYGEAQIMENVFLFQAGWVGRYIKNSFSHLFDLNPYLRINTAQKNTKEVEFYGGVKTTVGKHFNFSAKAGYLTITDLPLFINDTANDSKAFIASNETSIKDIRIHADLSYISQDKLTITSGVTFNGYTGMKNNAKAWGTVPFELNASLRWWAFKNVLIKGDFYTFAGGPYLLKDNTAQTTAGGMDLSAGLEFVITKNISVWADFNNILNNKYERWHNYQVYGLNILAGAIVKF